MLMRFDPFRDKDGPRPTPYQPTEVAFDTDR